MGAAVGAAVSVVGGIAGLSQQNSAAAAQKRALASQEKQQALNAQLQYLTIKNQSYADDLNDQINSSVRTLAYTQSMQNLQAQENLNQIAVQQALFDSGVQKISADINKSQQETQTAQQLSDANAQAGAGELDALASTSGTNVQDINSILQRLSQNGDASTGIANLLDIAASSGGINEALSLLTGGDVNAATTSAAQLARSQEVMGVRGGNAEAVANTTRQVAGAQANTSGISGSIQQSQNKFDANTSALDARTSGTVADQGFAATKAANIASNKIGILTDDSSAYSRKYLSAANLAALDQGAALQSDILNAQKSQIKTPGFLDYVGLGVGSYNTFKGLEG